MNRSRQDWAPRYRYLHRYQQNSKGWIFTGGVACGWLTFLIIDMGIKALIA